MTQKAADMEGEDMGGGGDEVQGGGIMLSSESKKGGSAIVQPGHSHVLSNRLLNV